MNERGDGPAPPDRLIFEIVIALLLAGGVLAPLGDRTDAPYPVFLALTPGVPSVAIGAACAALRADSS